MTVSVSGVKIAGVVACLPSRRVDNLSACRALYGDEAKAAGVVTATGIRERRVAEPGATSLDLCVAAAERLFAETPAQPSDVGAVIGVTFTPARRMPCNAAQAEKRLGLSSDILAFDVSLACSGYPYGLFLASTLARDTGRAVLLLDGDVQSAVTDPADGATVPVLADAGTATLVTPGADTFAFAFLSKGAGGEALTLANGGTIAMNGFDVYRFVAGDVTQFLRGFLDETGRAPATFDGFVPHQANVYMIRQLAKAIGFPPEKLKVSGDAVGNSASATVPVTLAWTSARGRLLLAGFGGGLSASAAAVSVGPDVPLVAFDFAGDGT